MKCKKDWSIMDAGAFLISNIATVGILNVIAKKAEESENKLVQKAARPALGIGSIAGGYLMPYEPAQLGIMGGGAIVAGHGIMKQLGATGQKIADMVALSGDSLGRVTTDELAAMIREEAKKLSQNNRPSLPSPGMNGEADDPLGGYDDDSNDEDDAFAGEADDPLGGEDDLW